MTQGRRIIIRSLSKIYHSLRRGRIKALENINIDIEPGELCVFVGPSGCGKSTLLNLIAGLENPSSGEIFFDDKPVVKTGNNFFMIPKERNVAMVFQSYALYPHMTVFDNISFPLRLAKMKPTTIMEKVQEVAARLEIGDLMKARPGELSGGQRQRVAIARAIVRHPYVFLLDEPLSNLDAQLRTQMRAELKNLQRKLAVTTIYVTHDQLEAMTLATKLAVMNQGRILQVGTPSDIYRHPGNTFVAGFIGTPPMNLIIGDIENEGGRLYAACAQAKIPIPVDICNKIFKMETDRIIVGIRPENIELSGIKRKSCGKARIKLIEILGDGKLLHVQAGDEKMIIKTSTKQKLKEEDEIDFYINPSVVCFFDADGRNIRGS